VTVGAVGHDVSFTGAAALMVQFVGGSGLDANYVCRRAWAGTPR
jgi:hypothetical protein